jgi:hypothetical protein
MSNNGAMEARLTKYASALGLELVAIHPIQRNKYCAIGRGVLGDGQTCVVKDYANSDPGLARLEAEGLEFYDGICRDTPGLKTCRLLSYSAQHNILAMSFMGGGSYTRFVYKALPAPHRRQRVLDHARALGSLLRELYRRRHDPEGQLGGFMREYMLHVSDRLGRVPGFGRSLLGTELPPAETLFAEARDCGEATSFCHGDCVPRNAHADDGGIGLIDWANTSTQSHILNDLYNFLIASRNMFLTPGYREQWLAAISDGLGDLVFDIRLHRFFYEYHRRRWLMLKLYARRPWPMIQALRGMLTFARPFAPARLGLLHRHVRPPSE